MIYYFSGTGNSRWVAERLAEKLNDRLVSIADAINDKKYNYSLGSHERIGWVFPTYSWGVPPIVLDFMKKWHIENYNATAYCYLVLTCGDDTGMAVEMWQKALGSVEGKAAFSVQMPNNYILMPGFDVDSEMVEREKLMAAPARIEEIAFNIAECRNTVDVIVGKWKRVKTKLIYPLFVSHAMSDKRFHVDAGKCTHCRVCVDNCPTHNITMATADSLPQWHGDCAMCLSCIHRCPVRAIDYGKVTQQKGRYFFKRLRTKR